MGCDPSMFSKQTTPFSFNPRTHMGCDQSCLQKDKMNMVSIHAPTWGATPPSKFAPAPIAVSIHAPTWGATTNLRHYYDNVLVSIHAPTWGATLHDIEQIEQQEFQSTHPHGVRPSICFIKRRRRGFNPRTHMGCDQDKGIKKYEG